MSVWTLVGFVTAPSLSLPFAALLVPALMFAATFLERGLALPGLGPSCVNATLFLPIEDGPAVSLTAVTTWFVVGPLASAGENDGVATVCESSGWVAETVFENRAVVNSEDMSVLPYLFTDDEIIDALPLLDFGSSVCRSLLQGRSCSIGRMSVAPLWVVFSIVSSVRAIQMLAALAFPFCFQFPLAASCAAVLVVFCLRFSGIERVSAFKFPLLLDPGLFEHVAHVWKGKLAKDESEENVSLLNSGAISFQVPSCGIRDGFLLAPGVREFWKERHWSIIDNDDRDAVVEISESKFVAAAAPGTCRSQPEKLEAVQSGQVIQFFIKGVRGTRTQVVRGESQDALGQVAGVMGMDMYAMVGGKVVDHSLSLECIGITPNCTVSFFFRLRGGSRDNVPGQWTCSFCFAERCWPVRAKCYRCGTPRQAEPIPFNDKRGKGPKGPLGRAPPKGPSSVPPTISSRPHAVPPRGGPPGAGVGDPPPPTPPATAQSSEDMVKALLLLQNVMTKEDFSKYEKLVLPPPKKEEKKKLREEELWRRCQKEESLKKQVQMHLEQIKKHEHNLEQQKIMLADVQLQLESVSLEVKALRALVAEKKEPEGPSLHAPLPAPREPPQMMEIKMRLDQILIWKPRHWILMMMTWWTGTLDLG